MGPLLKTYAPFHAKESVDLLLMRGPPAAAKHDRNGKTEQREFCLAQGKGVVSFETLGFCLAAACKS